MLQSLAFYFDFYDVAKTDFEYCYSLFYYMKDVVEKSGDTEFANQLDLEISDFMSTLAELF